jgi:peptidoglycan hydrolase-like protein with peptidoglycan-binding domain
MKKMLVRAAVLAMFTAGIGTTVGIAGVGTALACGQENLRSDRLAASLPQVSYGDSNQHVLGLQLALRAKGYQLNGTGNYAQNTLTAVQDYQRKHGINPSGIVGSKTWHALVGHCRLRTAAKAGQRRLLSESPLASTTRKRPARCTTR